MLLGSQKEWQTIEPDFFSFDTNSMEVCLPLLISLAMAEQAVPGLCSTSKHWPASQHRMLWHGKMQSHAAQGQSHL